MSDILMLGTYAYLVLKVSKVVKKKPLFLTYKKYYSMKGIAKFNEIEVKKLKKNDYVIYNNKVSKITRIEDDVITLFIPNTSVSEQSKIICNIKDIKIKLQLWVYDLHGKPIAPLSYNASYIKEDDLVNGWVKKVYYATDKYYKYFVVRCPFCKHVK